VVGSLVGVVVFTLLVTFAVATLRSRGEKPVALKPLNYTVVMTEPVGNTIPQAVVFAGSINPIDLRGRQIWVLNRPDGDLNYQPHMVPCTLVADAFSCPTMYVGGTNEAKEKGKRYDVVIALVDAAEVKKFADYQANRHENEYPGVALSPSTQIIRSQIYRRR
jgi:hypothetical protein